MKTNVQQTSLEAYWDIEPKLANRQRQVLEYLVRYPLGRTNNEIANGMDLPINQVTPRIFELRKKRLVAEFGKRCCAITGRIALAWYVR